jgi:hypothetical protein
MDTHDHIGDRHTRFFAVDCLENRRPDILEEYDGEHSRLARYFAAFCHRNLRFLGGEIGVSDALLKRRHFP